MVQRRRMKCRHVVPDDDPATASDNPNLDKPADRLYSLLGVPRLRSCSTVSIPKRKRKPPRRRPLLRETRASTARPRRRASRRTSAGSFHFRSKPKRQIRNARASAISAAIPTAPTAAPAVDSTPAIDPAESDEFNKLSQQASSTKDSTAQYELAFEICRRSRSEARQYHSLRVAHSRADESEISPPILRSKL